MTTRPTTVASSAITPRTGTLLGAVASAYAIVLIAVVVALVADHSPAANLALVLFGGAALVAGCVAERLLGNGPA